MGLLYFLLKHIQNNCKFDGAFESWYALYLKFVFDFKKVQLNL